MLVAETRTVELSLTKTEALAAYNSDDRVKENWSPLFKMLVKHGIAQAPKDCSLEYYRTNDDGTATVRIAVTVSAHF